jgi:hypothetical protein
MGGKKLMDVIDWYGESELSNAQDFQVDAVRAKVETKLRPFHGSHSIDVFLEQFVASSSGPKQRYRMLLLRGLSRSGKTAKACSLFGSMNTLVANCQGMSPDLPSIMAFERAKHQAIVWDEIDEQQVLANKKVFQASVDPVALGQSKCNQHAYKRWLHAVPMILCSNVFAWPDDEKCGLPSEDADWLRKNIIIAPVPDGGRWYVSGDSSDEDE